MRKTLTVLAGAATIAVAAFAAATTADAGGRGWWGPVVGPVANPYCCGGSYSYYAPAPVYYDYYQPRTVDFEFYAAPQSYYPECWRFRHDYRYRVC